MQVINLIGLSEDDFLACAEDGLKRKIEYHQKLMLTAASLCMSSTEDYKNSAKRTSFMKPS